jgi:hypothetical protein
VLFHTLHKGRHEHIVHLGQARRRHLSRVHQTDQQLSEIEADREWALERDVDRDELVSSAARISRF